MDVVANVLLCALFPNFPPRFLLRLPHCRIPFVFLPSFLLFLRAALSLFATYCLSRTKTKPLVLDCVGPTRPAIRYQPALQASKASRCGDCAKCCRSTSPGISAAHLVRCLCCWCCSCQSKKCTRSGTILCDISLGRMGVLTGILRLGRH